MAISDDLMIVAHDGPPRTMSAFAEFYDLRRTRDPRLPELIMVPGSGILDLRKAPPEVTEAARLVDAWFRGELEAERGLPPPPT